ncbi:MAG: type II secretion system protein GspL [Gammaproteobacteria bacterium]|nr:type II secretion system protein GspL [Gammaproteobacteria bacterium]
MSAALLIHYNPGDAQQATWSMCNSEGELTERISTGSLTELSAAASGHVAIVLLNSQCLHINQLQLPTQNLQKILKAVPYAIEEFIADDIDDFHFVVAKNKHNSSTAVVGINRTTLKNIIQVFQGAGINVDKILPDALCLAATDSDTDSQWVCLNYKNHSYLQTASLNGTLVSHDLFPYVLRAKIQNKSIARPKKILFFCEQENTSAFDQLKPATEAEAIIDEDIELHSIVYNKHPLVIFCGSYKQAMPLNLLQYKFKPRRKTSGYLRYWRLAASLAAIWLVLYLGLTSFQRIQLENENDIILAKIEKIYKQTFPKSKKIVNPRVQMEQKLKELKNTAGGGNNGLIFLLAESFGTLSDDRKNITLQSLTFRNNRMDIGLDSNNLQTIETLNRNLNNNKNIKSEITSSSSEKDKVKGNLRIESRS